MQRDWDSTNRAAAVAIVQLCAPRRLMLQLHQRQTIGGLVETEQQPQVPSASSVHRQGQYTTANTFHQHHHKQAPPTQESATMQALFASPTSTFSATTSPRATETQSTFFFWVERLEAVDIRDFISMFRNEYRPPQTLWIERQNYNMDQENKSMPGIGILFFENKSYHIFFLFLKIKNCLLIQLC